MTHQRSFTLLEIVIAAAILLLSVGAALSLFVRTDRSVSDSLAYTDLDLRANRLESFLRSELSDVLASSILVEDTGAVPGQETRITYRRVTGYSSGAVTTTNLRRIQLEFDGETRNNSDDDNNGFIDEAIITFWDDADGSGTFQASERTVLARGIASQPEDYGSGNIGSSFLWRIESSGNTSPSPPAASDSHLTLNYSILGREPSTGRIRVLDRSMTFVFMN